MGMGEDLYGGYELPDESDRIDYIKVIENGKVVEKAYCLNCGSINILTSKKDNQYCGEICWEKEDK